jgi:hypothetical protein
MWAAPLIHIGKTTTQSLDVGSNPTSSPKGIKMKCNHHCKPDDSCNRKLNEKVGGLIEALREEKERIKWALKRETANGQARLLLFSEEKGIDFAIENIRKYLVD